MSGVEKSRWSFVLIEVSFLLFVPSTRRWSQRWWRMTGPRPNCCRSWPSITAWRKAFLRYVSLTSSCLSMITTRKFDFIFLTYPAENLAFWSFCALAEMRPSSVLSKSWRTTERQASDVGAKPSLVERAKKKKKVSLIQIHDVIFKSVTFRGHGVRL